MPPVFPKMSLQKRDKTKKKRAMHSEVEPKLLKPTGRESTTIGKYHPL